MVPAEMDERKKKILWAVVKEYIENAGPIGSSILQKKYCIDVCPATIRNEMAYLEEQGFLTHPHTSAGRIPTDKGYRFYVDNLMKLYQLTSQEKHLIAKAYVDLHRDLDMIMQNTLHLLLSLSNYFAVVSERSEWFNEKLGQAKKAFKNNRGSKIYFSGLSKLLGEPEFENTTTIRSLVSVFEDDRKSTALFEGEEDNETVVIRIGEENAYDELKDYSLVSRKFHCAEEPVGTLGIIGPKRMNYSRVATTVDQIAQSLDKLLSFL